MPDLHQAKSKGVLKTLFIGSGKMADSIQCDEGKPQCYQCVSSGWKCPGPVDGTIFIDMSENVRQKKSRSVAGRYGKTPRGPPSQKPPRTSNSLATLIPDFESQKIMLAAASKVTTYYQPDSAQLFQDLYISYFISLQDASVHPWITDLPKLALSLCGESTQSELYGIRAATMALYGRMCGNKNLELEASKWYSKGLAAQRKALSLAVKTESYQPCIYRAIGAALMFSYFESVMCTMPLGWMQHYIAATKMFEIAGPEKCQTGLMHMFFRSIRVASVRSSTPLYLYQMH